MVADHLQDVRLSVHHVLILENLFDGNERVGMFLTSLKKLKTGKDKTGKQCRERWQHQLNPSIVREDWTDSEVRTLF